MALSGQEYASGVVVVTGLPVPARQLLIGLGGVARAASYPRHAVGHGAPASHRLPPLARLVHLDGAVDEAVQLHHVRPAVLVVVEVGHLCGAQVHRAGRRLGEGEVEVDGLHQHAEQGRAVTVGRPVQDGSLEGYFVRDLGAAQPYGPVGGEPVGEVECRGRGVVQGEGHSARAGALQPRAPHVQAARQLRLHQPDLPSRDETALAEDTPFHGQATGGHGPSSRRADLGPVEEYATTHPGVA